MKRTEFLGHVRDYLHTCVEDEPVTLGMSHQQVDELDNATAVHLWADDPRFTLDEIISVVDKAKTMAGVNAALDATLIGSWMDGYDWRFIDEEAAAAYSN